jgi:trimethylamine--corrinoid protein Co-methyltransferase
VKKEKVKTMNKTNRQVAPINVFSNNQLDEIHMGTLEVLRRTGIKITHPEAVELLSKAGCWIDGERVRIPSQLIEWAINTAPKRVVLCNREGDPTIFLEGYRSYFGCGSDCVFVIDPYSGERRDAVLADTANFAKLVDALPNMDFAMSMSVSHDVPEAVADIHQFYAMVSNTVKPMVYATWGPKNLKVIVEIAETIAGGAESLQRNPFAALFGCPISPLQYSDDTAEALLYLAGKDLPYISAPSALAGGTAPITLAGAMVQINADMLAGLLLAQLKREGAPYILFSGCPNPMDMKTMIASYASPEFLLFQAGLTQLQHHLKIPSFGTAGCSDSKLFDEQAAIEGALSMFISSLSGANLIHDVGYIEYGSTSCFEQVVVMDEVAGEVRFFLNGIKTDREQLALEVIDRVGPGGEYVTSDHTLSHFREGWSPAILGNRDNYENWVEKGGKTLGQRANERVKEILSSHAPKPLSDDIETKVKAMIADAETSIS